MSYKSSGYALAPNELYQTPAWVTRVLLRFLPLSRPVARLLYAGKEAA